MRFPSWSKAKRRAVSCRGLACACLLAAASCRAQVAGNSPNTQTQSNVLSLNAEEAPADVPKMQVVSSVPLPEIWKKMGNTDRVGCSSAGDLLFQLVPAEVADMSHEIARVGANGAMLGYFDLRQTPGFEKATIQQAMFDSAGRIVLLVRNLIAAEVMRSDAEGRPQSVRFRMDHTLWVLTVDDSGKILSKFSFNERVVSAQRFALFKNGNVLVTGLPAPVKAGMSLATVVIFSPDGANIANVKVPAMEDQQSTMSDERSGVPVGATFPAGSEAATARVRRPPPKTLVPIAGGDDEIFLLQMGDNPFLVKVSADGTLGPKVKLAVPEDERIYVQRIAGHRALVSISSAQRLPPGTIMKAPEWTPKAVFDTESGTLLETLLMSMHETGPVCYSGSGMKAIRVPEGTLDTLER